MKKQYVVGFMFNNERSSVVLLRKNKPAWQAGLLNGIGGKIEAGETPLEAMVREFREETGASSDPAGWRMYCLMESPTFSCHCFVAKDSEAWRDAHTVEAEEVVKIDPNDIRSSAISNLKWCLEMALDENEGRHFVANVNYP